jgi:hypothetical protein
MLPHSHPFPLTDQTRNPANDERGRSDARAANERARSQAIAELRITRPESALFTALYYGFTIPASELASRAAQEDYNSDGPVVTEEECRVALNGCLAKGWMQVIDGPARTRIADDLCTRGVLGPIYGGLPDEGCVDFTETGAEMWRLRRGRQSNKELASYTDVVHERTAHYFGTVTAALLAIDKFRTRDDVVRITGPNPTGPWRAQWWRRFPEGYRIDIEERRTWQGFCSGGCENCYVDYSCLHPDSDQLRHVLDCHNVTLAEWLMLESMERDWIRDSAANLCRGAAESAVRLLGVAISEEQCRDALEACVRYGWLRLTDDRTAEEVQSLLANDPVLLAVPRMAQNRPQECCYAIDQLRPGKLIPIPMPAHVRRGEFDFSLDGATLYRMVSAEWLGAGWEDNLNVTAGYYWEEHHYCESDEGFEDIAAEHVAMGDVILARRVVPIGPWCVHWWDRFPSGYRLELELGTQ